MGLGAAAAMALGDPSADYGSIAAVGLFVALMCICIIVGHLLEENRWMNESITALLIFFLGQSCFNTIGVSLSQFICIGRWQRAAHQARVAGEVCKSQGKFRRKGQYGEINLQ